MRMTVAAIALMLCAAVSARAQTRPPSALDGFGSHPAFAMVEATSPTLLNSGQVDFALSIDVDVDADTPAYDLDDVLAETPDTPRYALVFDVAQAQASRRVLDLKSVASSVFLGYTNRPTAIDADDPVAGAAFASRLSTPNPNLAALGGSQALGAPLMFDYAFDTAQIRARRTMTVRAFLIDRVARTYIPTTFDASESRRFNVAYRISRYDPKHQTFAQTYDSEQDVDEFERAEMSIQLSALLHSFAQQDTHKKRYASATDLRRVLLTARNDTLAQLKANTFDARPLNDPRFDSVVVVYTGKGTLGAGFFVAPDVVLTNWHVVRDHRFVEMKMYDGQETFGTVLGSDARLDVALVRVQNRGRPVAFYTAPRIDVGQSVEAIGHPQRLEYSITRGVISAVRNHASINLPQGAGDEVLYIQTDAPINPGNSGGPLFLGTRVVGMNTWGTSKATTEGLNFAIHYSELMAFLNAHLPGYHVASGGD